MDFEVKTQINSKRVWVIPSIKKDYKIIREPQRFYGPRKGCKLAVDGFGYSQQKVCLEPTSIHGSINFLR